MLAYLGHFGLVSEELYAEALLQIPLTTKSLVSGMSFPLKDSEDQSQNEDKSTSTTAKQQEEPELPQGECDYKFLGREAGREMCSCIGFILDIPKSDYFCVCGHRATFHAEGKLLEAKVAEVDVKRETKLDKHLEHRTAKRNY